jgi:hypothetical protein
MLSRYSICPEITAFCHAVPLNSKGALERSAVALREPGGWGGSPVLRVCQRLRFFLLLPHLFRRVVRAGVNLCQTCDAGARPYQDTRSGRERVLERVPTYLPQRFMTAFVTASRTASWRIAH